MLFSNTAKGAKTCALIYSVVETAKENNLNYYAYLKYLFKEFPNTDVEDSTLVEKILPWTENFT